MLDFVVRPRQRRSFPAASVHLGAKKSAGGNHDNIDPCHSGYTFLAGRFDGEAPLTTKDIPRLTAGGIMAAAALLVGLLVAAGFERKEDHDADIEHLKAKNEADLLRVERKLDCALWEIPKGCRERMEAR